jgi:hypothetical protein
LLIKSVEAFFSNKTFSLQQSEFVVDFDFVCEATRDVLRRITAEKYAKQKDNWKADEINSSSQR